MFQFKNTIMYSLAIILLIVIIDLYRVTQLCIFPNLVELQMKDSTLMILGGVLLCFITILSVLINAPLAFSGLFCFGGAALVFAGLYELTVNFN